MNTETFYQLLSGSAFTGVIYLIILNAIQSQKLKKQHIELESLQSDFEKLQFKTENKPKYEVGQKITINEICIKVDIIWVMCRYFYEYEIFNIEKGTKKTIKI